MYKSNIELNNIDKVQTKAGLKVNLKDIARTINTLEIVTASLEIVTECKQMMECLN